MNKKVAKRSISFLGLLILISFDYSVNAQTVITPIQPGNAVVTPKKDPDQAKTFVFNVDGLNNPSAETTVTNALNKYPDRITAWYFDLSNQTVKVTYTNGEEIIDILEIINATGYKPWYMNNSGMKVVLESTGVIRELYVKP